MRGRGCRRVETAKYPAVCNTAVTPSTEGATRPGAGAPRRGPIRQPVRSRSSGPSARPRRCSDGEAYRDLADPGWHSGLPRHAARGAAATPVLRRAAGSRGGGGGGGRGRAQLQLHAQVRAGGQRAQRAPRNLLRQCRWALQLQAGEQRQGAHVQPASGHLRRREAAQRQRLRPKPASPSPTRHAHPAASPEAAGALWCQCREPGRALRAGWPGQRRTHPARMPSMTVGTWVCAGRGARVGVHPQAAQRLQRRRRRGLRLWGCRSRAAPQRQRRQAAWQPLQRRRQHAELGAGHGRQPQLLQPPARSCQPTTLRPSPRGSPSCGATAAPRVRLRRRCGRFEAAEKQQSRCRTEHSTRREDSSG